MVSAQLGSRRCTSLCVHARALTLFCTPGDDPGLRLIKLVESVFDLSIVQLLRGADCDKAARGNCETAPSKQSTTWYSGGCGHPVWSGVNIIYDRGEMNQTPTKTPCALERLSKGSTATDVQTTMAMASARGRRAEDAGASPERLSSRPSGNPARPCPRIERTGRAFRSTTPSVTRVVPFRCWVKAARTGPKRRQQTSPKPERSQCLSSSITAERACAEAAETMHLFRCQGESSLARGLRRHGLRPRRKRCSQRARTAKMGHRRPCHPCHGRGLAWRADGRAAPQACFDNS